MNEDEREMLKELHEAFLSVPIGSPKGTLTFLEECRAVVTSHKRLSWAGRLVVWVFTGVVGVWLSGEKVYNSLKDWFQ